jgi:hypothetical protein
MSYQFFHLRDQTRSHAERLHEFVQNVKDVATWGVFPGLFGLGTNEIYWVVICDQPYSPVLGAGIDIVAHTVLSPTVRPTIHEPRDKAGVYVFRWFEVDPKHVQEVVRLSGEAWETFEGGFDTEVQGLFTVEPPLPLGQAQCHMLLVTWYRDLAVWQDSRAPDPAARQRFVARQALLSSAIPIATRLEQYV